MSRIPSALCGLVVLVCALALPAPAAAQDFRAVLETQLDQAQVAAEKQGYQADPRALSSSLIAGILDNDGVVGLEIRLEPGRDYAVLGVCDADCTDLDLALADANGNVLARDQAADDTPVLEFNAPKRDSFLLLVHMVSCSSEPCSFGYRVFRR